MENLSLSDLCPALQGKLNSILLAGSSSQSFLPSGQITYGGALCSSNIFSSHSQKSTARLVTGSPGLQQLQGWRVHIKSVTGEIVSG